MVCSPDDPEASRVPLDACGWHFYSGVDAPVINHDRTVSLDEATRALPEVERILMDLREVYHSILDRQTRLDQLWTRVGDGDRTLTEIATLQESLKTSTEEFTALLGQLAERGCVLRDVETGLVDFTAFAGGVPIYLCWRLGEEGIQHWHSREEGFAGRKPLWKMPGTGPNYA